MGCAIGLNWRSEHCCEVTVIMGPRGRAKDLVPVARDLTGGGTGGKSVLASGTIVLSAALNHTAFRLRHPDRSSKLRTNSRTTLGMLYQ